MRIHPDDHVPCKHCGSAATLCTVPGHQHLMVAWHCFVCDRNPTGKQWIPHRDLCPSVDVEDLPRKHPPKPRAQPSLFDGPA